MQRREMMRKSARIFGVGISGGLLARSARGHEPAPNSEDIAAAIARATQVFMQAPIETTKLDDGFFVMTGPGGNIAVRGGPEGTLLVDSGFSSRAEDVAAMARKLGGKPVNLLINTHWHGDHTGGNAVFGRSGVRIVATENTRKRLATEQYIELAKAKIPPSPAEALPTLTTGDATLYVENEEIRLVAVPPAHTDSDLIVHFRKANVMHTGDLYAHRYYPSIDYSSLGTFNGLVTAAERMLALAGPQTRIIPGHGGALSDVKQLAAFHKMLAVLRDRITPLVEAGKTEDEVVAAAPTKDFDPDFGGGLFTGQMFTRMIFKSLVKEKEKPNGAGR